MKRAELIEQVRGSHARLLRALDGVTEEQAARVGLNPNWSVKDALAHITAWELEGAKALGQVLEEGYEPRRWDDEAINSFNSEAVEERLGHSMAEVTGEFNATHERVLELLGRLPEDVDENSPAYKIVSGYTIEHMEHHAGQVEEWRKTIRDEE